MALSLLAPQAATPHLRGLQVARLLLPDLMWQQLAPRPKPHALQTQLPPPLAKAVAWLKQVITCLMA